MSAVSTSSPATGLRYLPGLDGMRALAVIAVMVYHADSDWLPGGFLGVEVFFVISGYLITLLLLTEHARHGRIDLGRFWLRRARRLLPALFVLLFLVLVVTTQFRTDAIGRVRGDLVAGLTYVTNWFQIWTAQGYADAGDFAPLRHLWSLAVEEQFYLVWPLVMVALLRRRDRWTPDQIAAWLLSIAVVLAFVVGVLHHNGRIADCSVTPEAYWTIGERCISKVDALYLSTFTRAGGLLFGAALAFMWRPAALARGPVREHGTLLDLLAAAGMVTLVVLAFRVHFLTPGGADDVLFRGGFLFTDVATVTIIAAVAHPRARAGHLLGVVPLRWVGTRSYGLYLYHWPIYQLIRRVAGNPLTFAQFAVAVAVTVVIAELSYQLVELPIRTGEMRHHVRRIWYQDDQNPRLIFGSFMVVCLVVGSLSVVRLQRADAVPNPIEEALALGERDVVSVDELLAGSAGPHLRVGDQPMAADASARTGAEPDASANSAAGAANRADGAASEPVGDASSPTPVPPTASPTSATAAVAAATTTDPRPQAPVEAAPADPPVTEPPPTQPPPTEPPPTEPPPTEPPPTEPPPTEPPPSKPAPTQPTPTAPPPTESPGTDPPPTKQVAKLAIGDSVMLGAAGALADRGWVVNAEASRQMVDVGPTMVQLRDAGVFGDVVVVHLGTNGTISPSSLDAVLGTLGGVPRVVLLTIRADRSWTRGNNELIRSRRGGNVIVLDWARQSNACPGDCFADDGIHLTADGRGYYADLINGAGGYG